MAFGGSSEFRLIAGDAISLGVTPSSLLSTSQFGLGGGQIFYRLSSDESTDFMGTVGYFTGVGAPPYGGVVSLGGGGKSTTFFSIGILPGDLVHCIESTAGARPGRVTTHTCLRSTANFSTATYSTTGGWDVTLSNSS